MYVHVCVYTSIHDMCACVLNNVLTELHKTLTHSVPEEIKQSKESNPYCHHHSYDNRCLPFSQFSVLGVDDIIRDFPFPSYQAISEEIRRMSHQRSADDDSQSDDPDHSSRWDDEGCVSTWDVETDHEGRRSVVLAWSYRERRERERRGSVEGWEVD